MIRLLLVLVPLVAACAAPDRAPPESGCGASGYQSLLGSNIAAITLPGDLGARIYRRGDPVTMDHRPDRLNIETDDLGQVLSVHCG